VKKQRSIESLLFTPSSKPYGLTYPQWTVKWWQWLVSIPKENNPALDMSGQYAEEKQEDQNVWFLAGTIGGSVVRRCQIPSRKAILMPIINYECSFAADPSISTEAELKSKCEREIDDIKNLSFGIDGFFLRDTAPYRIRSPYFDVHLRENNILGLDQHTTRMISDGYWMFLKPLPLGSHQLISSGSCRSGKIMIGATYELTVQ
jgi:hypothetical protein